MSSLKPTLLAFCGKSATGKDTTAKWLHKQLSGMNIANRIIISDTTRPPRAHERDGIDYYFIPEKDFIRGINKNVYLEWSHFRGWYYGTNKVELDSDTILIGIFNPEGIKSLRENYNNTFNIIPVYLEDNCFIRLNRSKDREGRWRLEFFRRIFVDWIAFLGFKKIVQSFKYYIILNDEVGVVRRTRDILFCLQDFNII